MPVILIADLLGHSLFEPIANALLELVDRLFRHGELRSCALDGLSGEQAFEHSDAARLERRTELLYAEAEVVPRAIEIARERAGADRVTLAALKRGLYGAALDVLAADPCRIPG